MVSTEFISQLAEMGFSRNKGVRALHYSGNSTLEGAINWLDEHGDDKDIEEPLLLPKVRLRSVRSLGTRISCSFDTTCLAVQVHKLRY